jgi:hypothetical protein
MEESLTLEDRVLIQELIAKFTFSMDSGDEEGFLDCFTEDANVLGRSGRENLRGFLDDFGLDSAFPGSQHLASNFLIEGTSAKARVRWYITRMHKLAGSGNLQAIFLGWHQDSCVKVDGQWRLNGVSTNPAELLRGAPRPAERVPPMMDLGGPRGSH